MVEVPDIKAAVITRLLSKPEVTAITTNIGSVHAQDWGAQPDYMLIIRLAGTPGEEDWYEVGYHRTRLDFAFHGPTPERATYFWRVVHPVICPDQGSGIHSFTAEGVQVAHFLKEAGPLELIDPVTEEEFTVASYIATWVRA